MDNVFVNSRPIEEAEVVKSGAFTTLPVRINCRNDIADAASRKALRDWRRHMQDGQDEKSLTSISKLGNLSVLFFAEARPERLALLAYMNEITLVHDDVAEGSPTNEEREQYRAFQAAFDVSTAVEPKGGSRGARFKRLTAQVLVDLVNTDRELGMEIVEKCRKAFVGAMEKHPAPEFNSLEDYYQHRRIDYGLSAYWTMVEFGLGFKVSDHDKELVKDIFDPINEATLLTNDYWSWEREYKDSQLSGNRLVNAVDVERIVALENSYLEQKAVFYRRQPNVSLNLRRWIESAGVNLAGHNYWASSCDRHHLWRQNNTKPYGKLEEDNIKTLAHSQVSQEAPRPLFGRASNEGNEASNTEEFSSDGKNDGNNRSGALRAEAATSVLSMEPEPETKEKIPRKVNSMPTHEDTHLPSSLVEGKPQPAATDLPAKPREYSVSVNEWQKPSSTAISTPCLYICSMPSKCVRSILVEAFNIWLQIPDAAFDRIEGIVNLLHNASLILDDVEDNSPLRRGQPAVHKLFGHAQAINSANFMFVQAVQQSRTLGNPAAADLLLAELENLYLGQSWDLYWKYNLSCPTRQQYLNMVDNKTGGMFRLLLNLMAGESSSYRSFAFHPLTLLLGRFFQIRDDYMNLESTDYSDQKGFCEDLDEGKFSYPIVSCIETHPKIKDHILGIFRQRTALIDERATPLEYQSKMYILKLLKSTGTLEAVRSELVQMEEQIEREIGDLERDTGETNPILRLLLL